MRTYSTTPEVLPCCLSEGKHIPNAICLTAVFLAGSVEWVTLWLDAQNFLRLGAWALLGAFLPVLISVSVGIKKSRSGVRRKTLLKTYKLQQDRYFQLYDKFPKNTFHASHYLPIVIIAALCFFFAFLLIFTQTAIENEVPHLFTSGHTFSLQNKTTFGEHDVNTLIVVSYAYLGWYVWSVSTIFSRLVTMEFVPGTLYAIMTRLVLSIIVSAVLYQISALLPTDTWLKGEGHVEAIGFFTGLFPSTVLSYMKQWFKKVIQSSALSEEMRIDIIDGISPWRMFRLYDAGLDDCENLAAANPIELWDVTNLSLLEIIDWVGQAQLAVLLDKDLFIKLRSQGVRTSIDFHRIGSDASLRPVLVELTAYNDAHLSALLARMDDDPNFIRLQSLRSQIKKSDKDAEEVEQATTTISREGASTLPARLPTPSPGGGPQFDTAASC